MSIETAASSAFAPYGGSMTASRFRRIAGVLVFTVFGLLAVNAFLFGITLDGKEHPAVQCTRSTHLPESGGPFYENTEVTGERTFMPLGVNCTYDSPDDAIGPQTVQNANWPATVVWLGSTIITLYGASLAFRPRSIPETFPASTSKPPLGRGVS